MHSAPRAWWAASTRKSSASAVTSASSARGDQRLTQSPTELAAAFVESGAGEILVNSIDRDGTFEGYDLDLVKEIAERASACP